LKKRNMYKSPTLAVQVLISLVVLMFSGRICAEETFPGKTWVKSSSPAAAGWSAEKLGAADDFARTLQTDTYLVVQHGKIVHEYGDTIKATNVHSMRKSVLSILIGMNVDRGIFKIDKTLSELGIGDKGGLSDIEKRATVQQLLEARSGIYHPAAYETREMFAARPARGSFKPGENWYYNNWDFNALGTIFKGFTGKNVFESLRDDLAVPLQFEDFDFSTDTKFVYESVSDHPAYTMRLSARDLARLGWLMAQNGKWKDKQLVSAKWIAESTNAYSTAGPGVGYGYLWWVGINGMAFQNRFPGKVFSARGHLGQYLLVVPGLELVIVHKVDSESAGSSSHFLRHREVSSAQFGRLLGLIMAAAPKSD
jgi:CubicO group peptidase (beta-lactamase class C family)